MKNLFMSALVVLFVLVTTSGPGFGEKVTVTLQCGGDATVGTGAPNSNGGNSTTLVAVQAYGYGKMTTSRSFLRFYLHSIPANATFLSATLSIFCWSVDISSTPPNNNFDIHDVASWAWDELAITWNNQPSFQQLLARKAIPSGTFQARINWDLLANHSWNYAADLQGDKVLSVLLKVRSETLDYNGGLILKAGIFRPRLESLLRIEYEVPDLPRRITPPLGLLLDD